MNHASEWRLQLAREIATIYAEQPGVQMIGLGGSVAEGIADAYSDMDMLVYWDALDMAWLDAVPLDAYDGERFTYRVLVPDQVVLEQYTLGCAKFDVAHLRLDWWEETTASVVDRHETDKGSHDTLGGFVNAIALYGEPLYEQWRARIAAYPDALAEKMVREHLRFYPRWVLEQHGLARGELFSFYALMGEMVRNVVSVLAGINHVYINSEHLKHLDRLLGRMTHVPPDIAPRLRAILEGDRADAPALLASVIADVIVLVEQHMPQIDTTRTRWIQRLAQQPCDEKPLFQKRGA